LPGIPKIFHGRDSELSDLVLSLTTDSARVAILGPGGMGKTTLATAALHHPVIMQKYPIQHFVSCESTNTSFELVSMLVSHLGLENSRQLPQIIVQHFWQCGPCLLVLDNFETPWEPSHSRSKVENFLSTLTEVLNLALLASLFITMRGAERPGNVKWSKPFLPPIEPLSVSASRQIFVEVAEEPGPGEETALDELLTLSGNLPLAVSLMANIVSFEGYSGVLSRWHQENTALLSDGHNKSSNLEKSILLSLNGPRMSSSPNARDLLSLLSLFPDGVTVKDLIACQVPIPQIGQCASSLVQTSLAYMDIGGHIKCLVPIRENMGRVYPPSLNLCRPLRTHF
ncbi:P-loop containing nucleoside triphosphate hydrolase protein, partial [Mycena leptocephala]